MCVLYTIRQAHGKPIPVRITATVEWISGPMAGLVIAQRGEIDRYLIDDVTAPDDDGRVIEVYQSNSDPINDYLAAKESGYTVRIDPAALVADTCTCPGNNYIGRCKHADALRALIAAGELANPNRPLPMDEPTDLELMPF